jgi:hypothetical protein
LPSRPAELSRLLGGVLRVVHCNVPPWTARPPGRSGDGLRLQLVCDRAHGSTTTQRARTTRQRDPTWECNICVASASSSSEPEPAPCHRAANTQRRERLNELTEARRQLDEELAILHQELGMDPEPCNRQLA